MIAQRFLKGRYIVYRSAAGPVVLLVGSSIGWFDGLSIRSTVCLFVGFSVCRFISFSVCLFVVLSVCRFFAFLGSEPENALLVFFMLNDIHDILLLLLLFHPFPFSPCRFLLWRVRFIPPYAIPISFSTFLFFISTMTSLFHIPTLCIRYFISLSHDVVLSLEVLNNLNRKKNIHFNAL